MLTSPNLYFFDCLLDRGHFTFKMCYQNTLKDIFTDNNDVAIFVSSFLIFLAIAHFFSVVSTIYKYSLQVV